MSEIHLQDRLQFQLLVHNMKTMECEVRKYHHHHQHRIGLTILFLRLSVITMCPAIFFNSFHICSIKIVTFLLNPHKTHIILYFLLGYNMRTVTCIITLKLSDKSSSACFKRLFFGSSNENLDFYSFIWSRK